MLPVLRMKHGCSGIEVLADNNRLNEVPRISSTFLEIVASARGQVKAVVTTSQVRYAASPSPSAAVVDHGIQQLNGGCALAQKLQQKELADLRKGLGKSVSTCVLL